MKIKVLVYILLAITLASSSIGCSSKPSEEEIKEAIIDGKITVDDAKEKGWIDDVWIEKNFQPIEAKSKIHKFDLFETTYLDGSVAPNDIISGEMYVAFFNSTGDKVKEQVEILSSITEEFEEMGIPVLGVVTDTDLDIAKENLKDAKFPIVVYNEEMKKSLEQYSEIIAQDYSGVWVKEGGFYSSWGTFDTSENLLKYAESYKNEK